MAVNRAYIEAVLEGAPLPATRSDLIRHAKHAGSPETVRALRALPSRRFASLDEVGEALAPVAPDPSDGAAPVPVEHGSPPGGAAYGASRR